MRAAIYRPEEYAKKLYSKPKFFIETLLPGSGHVLLYGKSSVGKTPLTWTMASCISHGIPFFGLPTTKARVLYVDADNSEWENQERFRKLDPLPGSDHFRIWFPNQAVNVFTLKAEYSQEYQQLAAYDPELVFWNTLDRVTTVDAKDTSVPKTVYKQLSILFPSICHVLIHHEVKDSRDPNARFNEEEAFSGAAGWRNNAISCMRLVYADREKGTIRLHHTKSQTAKATPNLTLHLDQNDGVTLTDPKADVMQQAVKLLTELPKPSATDLSRAIHLRLGVGIVTAKRMARSVLAKHAIATPVESVTSPDGAIEDPTIRASC